VGQEDDDQGHLVTDTNETTAGGEPDPGNESKTYVWLTDLRLVINGNTIDQFHGKGDQYEAGLDYVRLLEVQGLYGENRTNSITREMFSKNFYVAAFNLTNSPNPNNTVVQPTVGATNTMQVRLEFSGELPVDLEMVCWSQISSAFTVNAAKGVNVSHYNTYNK
jgi:hypothetical protein